MHSVVAFLDSRFTVGDNTTALLQIGAVIDPLSEEAQKWSAILDVSERKYALCIIWYCVSVREFMVMPFVTRGKLLLTRIL
jgi:hypothetical protein